MQKNPVLERAVKRGKSVCQAVNMGADITDEERQFLTCIDRFKTCYNRPHPTWLELLAVIHEMGYRKVS